MFAFVISYVRLTIHRKYASTLSSAFSLNALKDQKMEKLEMSQNWLHVIYNQQLISMSLFQIGKIRYVISLICQL